MRMDYSNFKNRVMKFIIKAILGIMLLLISQGITAQFYVGVQSEIGSIQSDVAGTQKSNRLGGAVKAGTLVLVRGWSFRNTGKKYL